MQEKKKFKTALISMAVIACCFLLVGIIQTFVINSKKSALSDIEQQNQELALTQEQLKQIHDYMCTRTDEHDESECLLNNDYINKYYEYIQSDPDGNYYGEDGDIIIQ